MQLGSPSRKRRLRRTFMAKHRSRNKKGSIGSYDHDDPSLRTGDGGLTVWSLQEMARERKFKQLNHLFDNGLTMNALPVGVAAGTAALVLDIDVTDLIADCVNWLAAKHWRGKIF